MTKYTPPLRSEFFEYQSQQNRAHRPLQSFWSWLLPPDQLMQECCEHLKKRQRIWKRIPGIKSVFLCDTLSFNAYTGGDAISFFVVTKKNHVRTVYLFLKVVFFLVNTLFRIQKKTFVWSVHTLVDEDHQDFSRVLLSPSDPYVLYYIAHLVPLYYDDLTEYDLFFEKNNWITLYLHSFPCAQAIFLPLESIIGVSWSKSFINRLLDHRVGMSVGLLIGRISIGCIKVIRKKTLKTEGWKIGVGFFITGEQKRKWYSLQREIANKAIMKQKNQ